MTGNYTIDTKTSERFGEKVDKKASFDRRRRFPKKVHFAKFFSFSKWPSGQYLRKGWKFWEEWVEFPFCEALHFFSKLIKRANLSTPSVSQLNSFLHILLWNIFFKQLLCVSAPPKFLFFSALDRFSVIKSNLYYQLCLIIKS
jgi:hypothetical protein